MIKPLQDFFASGNTQSLSFRKQQLVVLGKMLKENEKNILRALYQDLRKPEMEAFLGEINFLYREINTALKNLDKWCKVQKVSTPLQLFPAKSYIHTQPKGVVLIISPWNYPVRLLIGPLIGAMAAGNCAVLKPSELTPKTSELLAALISKNFDPNYILVKTGSVQETQELLQKNFDHVFFTGSMGVAKIIMKTLGEKLTPVTLELGGKSPCIVEQSADLKTAARRIIWGKFFNAGQTCVAPDYLLVQDSIYQEFLQLLKQEIKSQDFNTNEYAKIVNQKHFERLCGYLNQGEIIEGGVVDKTNLSINPTLMINCKLDSVVMSEEIFGPILPIVKFNNKTELQKIIKQNHKPLAFYTFSNDSEFTNWCINNFSFGGGCINDVLIHMDNANLPFGGVGESGMGSYHGKYSFDVFSHQKSIVKNGWLPDFKFRYRPYEKHFKVIKKLYFN